MMALRIVKNRKPTILPLSQTIVEVLNHYLKFRKGSEEDYIFCNAMGGQVAWSCLGCYDKFNPLDQMVKHGTKIKMD